METDKKLRNVFAQEGLIESCLEIFIPNDASCQNNDRMGIVIPTYSLIYREKAVL